jgi:hypothetical protein
MELFSKIAPARKPFEIGHTNIYTYLLRMADTMGAGIAQLVSRLATGWTTRGSGSSSPGK